MASIKHPIWASVGTVVGMLALALTAITYVQSSSSEGRLSIAAVTLGAPVDLAAVEVGPTGYPEDRHSISDIAAEPIDVTIKNDGGSAKSIDKVSVAVVKSEYVQSCLRQGAGGVGVSAEYAIRLPPSLLSGEVREQPVSTDVDFTVNAGETGRFVVTVGPEQQAENTVMVMALRLTFSLSDGSTLHTDPVVIGTTQEIIDSLVAEVESADPGNEEVARLCAREVEKIDGVVGANAVRADAVARLREAYKSVS